MYRSCRQISSAALVLSVFLGAGSVAGQAEPLSVRLPDGTWTIPHNRDEYRLPMDRPQPKLRDVPVAVPPLPVRRPEPVVEVAGASNQANKVHEAAEVPVADAGADPIIAAVFDERPSTSEDAAVAAAAEERPKEPVGLKRGRTRATALREAAAPSGGDSDAALFGVSPVMRGLAPPRS